LPAAAGLQSMERERSEEVCSLEWSLLSRLRVTAGGLAVQAIRKTRAGPI